MELQPWLARRTRMLLAAATGLIVMVFTSSCSPTVESVRIAQAQFESAALVWIAEDQRFFRANGLAVTSAPYETGVSALNAMLNGEADIAVGTSEFPLVAKAFQRERIRIIGSIDKIDFVYLVGRKDRGIERVADLKGKRIGTTLGTIAEFYLGRFLNLNAMTVQDITLVDIKAPAEYGNAVADGAVDAVVSAQPNADSVRNRLGANAVVLPVQSGQPQFALLVSTDEWVTKHPELLRKLLRSLAQAEGYLSRSPADAKGIVQKRLNLDAAYLEANWSRNQFSLSLDQSLVVAMEDEARWMISNNATTEKQVPSFRDYIYVEALRAVKPEAVNIIP